MVPRILSVQQGHINNCYWKEMLHIHNLDVSLGGLSLSLSLYILYPYMYILILIHTRLSYS